MNSPSNGSGGRLARRAISERAERALPGATAPVSQGEISVSELWQLLLKRRKTFFWCVGLVMAAAVMASVILPTRYEAVARLTLDFENNAIQDAIASASGAGGDGEVKLLTQVKVAGTDALAWSVIRQLRLDRRPEAAHRRWIVGPAVCLSAPNQSFESISPECRDVLLKEFHSRLRVEALPRTQIMEIRYRSKSRELAAQVVNTMAEVYTESSFQTKYSSAMRASRWIASQLQDARDAAQKAEEKYIAYQKQTGIIGTDENHNVLMERLNALNQQLVVAEAARIVHEARYRASLEGDPEALVEITPGSPLQVLHAQKEVLESQYSELQAKFDQAYPRVRQLKAQLDETNAAIAREAARSRDKIKSEYEAALRSETLLRGDFEAQKQQVYNTNESALEMALLKRDVDASRTLYEELTKQLDEAGVRAGLNATHVTVIDPASMPIQPVEPHRGQNLVFGLLGGSLLGLAVCFIREQIDTRILSPQDLTGDAALPALGIVPRLTDESALGRIGPGNGLARIATLERPEGVVADAYRSLRTTLLLSSPGAPPRVLLMASALPREGKTTTSVNLAAVFAQKDARVLLVDGDLRKADLSRSLNFSKAEGLSAALAGEDPRKFYVHHGDLPNLTILPAGGRPPKPSDLLDSDRMRELISLWRQEFDRVILDSPPLIGLIDSVVLATMADAVILVLRARQSHRQETSLAQEILAGVNANVCGAVINDFRFDAATPYGYSSKLYGSYFYEKGIRNGHG